MVLHALWAALGPWNGQIVRWASAGAIAAVTLVSSTLLAYNAGKRSERNRAAVAQVAAIESAVATERASYAAANSTVESLRGQLDALRTNKESLDRELKNLRGIAVPRAAGRMLNAAAISVPSAAAASPGTEGAASAPASGPAADADAPIDLGGLIETVNENYLRCNSNAAQLRAIQDFYNQLENLHDQQSKR